MLKRSVVVAFVVSFLAHGLMALAFVVCLEYVPVPDALATLDLSSVELSFAERTDELAASVVETSPMPSATHVETWPQTERLPPNEQELAKPLPPDPSAPKFREPEETPRGFVTEDVRRKTDDVKDERREANAASVAAPQQARIDAPPRPLRTIKPVYPRGARRRGEQGEVELDISVGIDGEVEGVTVVRSSGFAEIDAAAVQASRTARFTPAKSGNAAVPSRVRLPIDFKLK